MKTCENCRWYAEYVSTCCNGESKYRAGFVRENGTCEKWEEVPE